MTTMARTKAAKVPEPSGTAPAGAVVVDPSGARESRKAISMKRHDHQRRVDSDQPAPAPAAYRDAGVTGRGGVPLPRLRLGQGRHASSDAGRCLFACFPRSCSPRWRHVVPLAD